MWYMNKQEIKLIIESHAKKDDFYKKLLYQIKEQPEILEALEYQNFKHPLDLINFLEK